jgi:hypothetical protein
MSRFAVQEPLQPEASEKEGMRDKIEMPEGRMEDEKGIKTILVSVVRVIKMGG